MIYTSIENKKVKMWKKLHKKKYRDQENLFLLEGEHLVTEAYEAGVLKEVLIKEGTPLTLEVPIFELNDTVLNYISQLETPSPVIGVCHKITEQTEYKNRILLLDDLQDPGNLGTIIRSAVAFHVDTIILSENTVDLYNDKVIRSTQGMLFHVNIVRKNKVEELQRLKKLNYKILGTKVNGGKSLKTIEKCEKFVIIMGNEGNGMSGASLSHCDELIYIDIDERCESLNVGVAASIILYELDK